MLAYNYKGHHLGVLKSSNKTNDVTPAPLIAIGQEETVTDGIQGPERIVPINTVVDISTFAVTFSFAGKLHSTRVMKVKYGYGSPLYKVVLTNSMKSANNMCWLIREDGSWTVVMGQESPAKLISAIELAIEGQE